MTTAVTQAIIDGFFDASNGDSFATLGMHETERGIEIRTLLPDANRVVVIERESGKEITELDCVDERGFFVGVISNCRHFFAYQLQVFWGNESQIVEDPYRFHPMIDDLEQWLLSEGSMLRPYEVLGAHFIDLPPKIWTPILRCRLCPTLINFV